MKQFWFMVVKGTNEGRRLDLERGITLLGRLEEPTSQDPPGSRRWTIHDPTVSRTHCAITWTEGHAPVITHLSSTNDTLVGGARVKEHTLTAGDLIQVGLTHLVLNEKILVQPPEPETQEPEQTSVSEEVADEYVQSDEWAVSQEVDAWGVAEDEESGWAPTIASESPNSDSWTPR